jgi:hypothetical protein
VAKLNKISYRDDQRWGMANELFGWISILLAVAMGMWMGIRFQHEGWLGGYGSLPRRMVRLAHIALAALGILNVEFAHTVREVGLPPGIVPVASWALIVAGFSMPACCLLIARGFRRFEIFAVPVVSLSAALLLTIGGLIR